MITIKNRFVIRTASSLENLLKTKPKTDRQKQMWYYLNGIYDTRLFGLVVYRLNTTCNFKNK